MSKHALLSASKAARWIACPPSLMLEKDIPDTVSEYAREGTVAHELAEIKIRHKIGMMTDENYRQHYEIQTRDPLCTFEMTEYIDTYADWVEETYNLTKADCEDAILLTEQRLNYSRYAPDGFGTGDVVIIADGTMTVIDLKYGKGVPVSAELNPQLMLYGLGAIEEFGLEYDIQKVRLIINQPRLGSISSAEYSADELIAWGENTVLPAAEKAIKGEGLLQVGDHCRFCKAFPTCRAQAEEAQKIAKSDFAEPNTLDGSEVESFLESADMVKKWLDALQEYALKEALSGRKWENWKAVEGRSNRKYKDELEASKALTDAGYDEAILYERKFLTITNLEKAIGKKMVKELLENEGHIIKPKGKPTLVKRSDGRKEISAASDFADDFKEESEE